LLVCLLVALAILTDKFSLCQDIIDPLRYLYHMIQLKHSLPEVFDHNLLEVDDESATVIYCDMDGVIADFEEGFKKISGGVAPDEFDATNRSHEIWKLIWNNPPDNGITWWATLPKMKDGDVLWKFITALKLPVKILSSTSSKKSKSNSADIGKRRWLATNLVPPPDDQNIMLVDSSEAKQQYALGPNHILIDDLPANIAQWRAKGGTAIEHKNAVQTIGELKRILGIAQESYGYSWSNI
jgi:hypothetical protein